MHFTGLTPKEILILEKINNGIIHNVADVIDNIIVRKLYFGDYINTDASLDKKRAVLIVKNKGMKILAHLNNFRQVVKKELLKSLPERR